MWQAKRLVAQARAFLRPRRADEEMSREMATHLAMLEDEFRRRGLSPEEARFAAQCKFGAVERASDLHREARTLVWLEHLRQDLRYTLRTLTGNKGYTAIAVATLALGIGANSAVFSVIHPLMIEPLPFDRPEQLVQLTERAPPTDWIGGVRRNYPLPPDRSRELAEQAGSIAGLFQYFGYSTTLFERGDPTSVNFAGISEGMFSTLRARPFAGRLLEPDDHEVGADPVVVISHAAWQKHWRGDSNVLGQTAALDTRTGRHRYRIIGVLPEDFVFPVDVGSTQPLADFLVPGNFSGHGTGSGLTTVLRVRDDASVDAAADEIDAVLAGMGLQTARFDAATGEVRFAAAEQAELVPVKARQIENIRPALLILMAMVGAVLLIACTNVANLMLGRAATRKREIAIRSSLGASRGRLVRQVFTESLVLSLSGGIAGTVVAYGGIRFMAAWPGNALSGTTAPFLQLPRIDGIALDGAVFAFTFGIALLTGLLFGLAPALALGRASQLEQIKDAGASASASGRAAARGRDVLIVAQVALAMTLLVGAGLLTRSFLKLTQVEPGFSADDTVVTFDVTASRSRFEEVPPFGGGVPYFDDLTNRLEQLRGVESAGYGPPPFQFGSGTAVDIDIPGRSNAPAVNVVHVSEDYLETLGVPLQQGRHLSARDDAGGPLAMLVNDAFVREHLGGRSPLGMLVGTSIGRPGSDAQIVGVVGDVRQGGLDSEPYPQVFVDYRQAASRGNVEYWRAFFAVRTTVPDTVIANSAGIVRRFDPEARVENTKLIDEFVADTIMAPRFLSQLLMAFAAIGAMLAAIGLYGVISYAVTQRTREIGLRMALGANRGAVLSMVLRRGAALSLAGIAMGLLAALAGSRYLASLLFGIEPLDAPTFAGVTFAFFVVAILASFIPARRATQVDPLVSLRHE